MTQRERATTAVSVRRSGAAFVRSRLSRLASNEAVARMLAVAILPFALWTAIVTVFYAAHPLRTDFVDAFIQARVVLVYGWPHAYDVAALELQRQLYEPIVWFPQNYPPLMTVTVLPFALLPLAVASWLWTALMALVLVACWHLLAPAGRLRERLPWLLVAFGLPPVAMAFRWQALYTVAVLVIVVAWRLDRGGRHWLAGAVLAGSMLKPQLAFLLPVALLASGNWRTLLAGAASAMVIAATLLALLGPTAMGQWLGNVSYANEHPLEDGVLPRYGLATIFPHPYVYLFMAAVAGLVALAAWRGRRSGISVAYVAGLAGSQVAAPFIHPADWVITAVAVGILLAHTRWRWRVHFAVLAFVSGFWVFGLLLIPLALITFGLLASLAADPAGKLAAVRLLEPATPIQHVPERPAQEPAPEAAAG